MGENLANGAPPMITNLESPRIASDLNILFGPGAVGRLTDKELLARFVSHDDPDASEAAFATLLSRHGPMVLGVCRRMVRDEHLAADAYQAVFLILARKARSVRVDDSLGRWLYGVSVRVARRARALIGRERDKLKGLEGLERAVTSSPHETCERDDLRAVVDEEIERLPSRYRVPVVLCYLQGMTGEEAARRLKCPVGTLESRLHRARERLRTSLRRRGLAPTAGAMASLATMTARADVPRELSTRATDAVARLAGGRSLAGAVSAASATLITQFMRSTLMTKGCWSGLVLMTIGLSVAGAGVFAGAGDEKQKGPAAGLSPAPHVERKPEPTVQPLAERFRQIRAEYDAQQAVVRKALESAKVQSEMNKIYQEMSPDEVAFCRRMLDLAASAPKDPVARDALLWVVNKPGMMDHGAYGDEFARAASLLVRHHGDDPDAVRIGLGLDNVTTPRRVALLMGFYAAAKCREAKGLARLALAQYLEAEAKFVASAQMRQGRQKNRYLGLIDDNGKSYEKEVEQSDEEYSYVLQLRLRNPDAMRAEAERLFDEVIADFGDVPCRTEKDRELEALLKQPSPSWNGKPLRSDERRQLAELVARKRTLAQVALARLDDIRNVIPGKPAPEIAGVDLDGKPLKLSDYRGKVVVLVFWGSWCGPCMREVPHECELAERYKDKPFAVLGVNCGEEKAAAVAAVKSAGITWPNWNDGGPVEGAIAKRYHIGSYPTVFVIDKHGIIRHKQILGSGLDQAVEELLRELDAKDLPPLKKPAR
jgi:RNA polymerase sigma factor (sigma-70 family)